MSKNRKSFDVRKIVDYFGGKHQIVSDFENRLRQILTVKAVEKWIERGKIPSDQLLNLKTIAEKRQIPFVLEEYIV